MLRVRFIGFKSQSTPMILTSPLWELRQRVKRRETKQHATIHTTSTHPHTRLSFYYQLLGQTMHVSHKMKRSDLAILWRREREQFDKKTWQGPATFEEAIIYWTPMQIFATVSPFVSQASTPQSAKYVRVIN